MSRAAVTNETVETWRNMCFNVQGKKKYLCQHCGVCEQQVV